MKKIIAPFALLLIAITVFGQNDTEQPPYKRYPTFPPVKLLLPDSLHYFTKQDLDKKKPVMLMVFNPQCEHCQHETEELVKHIDEFKKKDIQIVMSTSMPFDSMMNFRERYKLAEHKNIIVAQDANWFLPTFYMLNTLPFLAFYDKKKDLISVFQGSMPMEKILEVFKD